MSGAERTTGLLTHLALALLLVTAQAGMAVHAFEHDAGVPQAKTCSVCVTAAQLGAASVGEPVASDLAAAGCRYDAAPAPALSSRNVLVTRQRGPPAPL